MIQIIDFRNQLQRANWSIGKRKGLPRYLTIHYNGPAVSGFGNPKAEREQLKFDARYHINKNWGNDPKNPIHGDGIMYHGATLSDGSNLWLRDYDDILWHCGVALGNQQSVSWQLPLGGNQRPTAAQERSLYDVINHFTLLFDIDWHNILGHKEWKPTACPGNVMPLVIQYRANPQAKAIGTIQWYETLYNVNVREGPSKAYPISLQGKAVLPQGNRFASDVTVKGEDVDGKYWVHKADQVGFIRRDLVSEVTANQMVQTFTRL